MATVFLPKEGNFLQSQFFSRLRLIIVVVVVVLVIVCWDNSW